MRLDPGRNRFCVFAGDVCDVARRFVVVVMLWRLFTEYDLRHGNEHKSVWIRRYTCGSDKVYCKGGGGGRSVEEGWGNG